MKIMEKNCLVSGTILKGTAYTYKIERVLGQGTFGITYLATTDVKLEGALGTFSSRLRVAVKEFFMRDINGRHDQTVTCGTQGGLYEHYRHKFAREAQNLSKLNHPHIVRVLESFEANNTVYYAMEYCEGGSLDELIGRDGLAEGQALAIAHQIGSALDYMHRERVLHLDLKPGNIMLRSDDEATLIDFGLSKQYDEQGTPESSTTIGGGTPGYAPLEQSDYREGKDFPVQMDIYALGATLFKMLTGERPAEASVLLNEGFPTEKLTAKGVSKQTIAVIERAMSPMKRDRYGSVAEFLKALGNPATTPTVEEDTRLDDPAIEATVVDEEKQKPTPKPTPKPQPAPRSAAVKENPITPIPKKKGSKKWLWSLLIALLVVLSFVVGRMATNLSEEPVPQPTIIEPSPNEAIEQQIIAIEQEPGASRGKINGHEWVDLGLSVKWATCNVGASSPSAYGNYYAWGETRTKSEYYTSNSATYEKSMGDIAGSSYDAARANWGSSWRLPTKAEFQELLNNCTWTWTSQGGHNGYKVTGKNGNSIFLPAAGWRDGSSLYYAGEYGYYWGSTPHESDSQAAYSLLFGSGGRGVYWNDRGNGYTVRPVSE